jgi:hypothetical protein
MRLKNGVRILLGSERLLPAHDGSFASASEAKLARGAGLLELMTDTQLSELYDGRFKWLTGEITQDRTPLLRAYLINTLKIEEIDPEALARGIKNDWLERQSDEWMIAFYQFLHGQRALWRPSPNRYSSPGVLRSKAIIRLADGSHVVPFRENGLANAYISPATGTDFPTVRAALVADEEACAFLRDLGLKEPDPVAEIIERVIPKYADATSLSEQQHRSNLQKILTVFGQVSQERRQELAQALRGCPFLSARNCGTSISEFKKPGEIYFPNPEISLYFAANPNAWLMEEPTIDAKAFDTLRVLGVRGEPKLKCEPNSTGYVTRRDSFGDHARGLNGFDGRCEIDGLRHALVNIDFQLAQYLWNELLPAHRRHLHGTVQRSSRQSYDPWSIRESHEYSATGKLLTENAWLPDKSGIFRKCRARALQGDPRRLGS